MGRARRPKLAKSRANGGGDLGHIAPGSRRRARKNESPSHFQGSWVDVTVPSRVLPEQKSMVKHTADHNLDVKQ